MVSAKLTAVALATLVLQAAAGTINTPTALIQCQPVQLSSNVFLAVLPGGQSAALPIEDFGELPASPAAYTWTVNVPAGTAVTLRLTDSTGVPAYTEQVTVQPGSSSCLSGSASASAATSAAGGGATNTRSSAAQSSMTMSRSSAAAGGASSSAPRNSATGGNSASGGNSAPAASQSSQPTSGASALTVGSGLLAGVAALVAVVA
ncbi:hypothetical protein OIV83_002756 [Microbotryomycetes sp. JL201]|nr:hypothetical protein OIV83_002756 [Microbotryomycetes sp. JL201]